MRSKTEAAELAGFKEVEFCPEPVAAALQFRHESRQEELILVADFGGGTSDFTILKVSEKEFQPSDVLALKGVSIAGDKYDGAIMKHISFNALMKHL
ncbi:MAG: Hsp70 family protein [Oligoflexus sp.]